MRLPKRCLLIAFSVICMASCRQGLSTDTAGWELKPPSSDALPVTAERMLPGIYPAGSQIVDKGALGGFGPCKNYPFNLGQKNWGTKGALSLVAFPEESVAYFKHRGIALRVV